MKKILLVSHGEVAREFGQTVKMFTGEQEWMRAVCLSEEKDMEIFEREIKEVLKEVTEEDYLIAFSDIPGGTPANVTLRWMQEYRLSGLFFTGMNLAAILVAVLSEPSEELEEEVLTQGRMSLQSIFQKENVQDDETEDI